MKISVCIIVLLIALPTILRVCIRSKYQTNNEWSRMHYAVEDFSREKAKQLGMRFLFAGDDTRAENAYVGFSLMDEKNVTLDQGRSMAQQLAKDLMSFARVTPSIQDIVIGMYKARPNPGPYDPFLLKNTSFRIGYWNKEYDRPKAPYLAEIQFYDGKIHYYEADPVSQALILIHEDPFIE